ncbi:DUF1376 domain-containing protein [Pseudoroseomonas cervicalis]|uniref:DUF1376 domain-containing protein n=1 Tax=Teichococcus cervicalis TaxID=204525 RepID=UPI0027D7791E|nr:DUF1376 domain-containing protein [Pseudoroseomonas cervicalis]
MPLDVVRLIDSDLFALSTGDEFKAAVALWCKAFLQRPAGSLPDDDRILAHLSAAGARWAKVKEMALRGWVLCADGRLYHPVVAEKVVDAWQARLSQRARTEAARAAKAARKADHTSVKPGAGGVSSRPVTGPLAASVASSVTDDVTSSKGEGRESKGIEEREDSPLRYESSPPNPPQAGGTPELFEPEALEARSGRIGGDAAGRAARRKGFDDARMMAVVEAWNDSVQGRMPKAHGLAKKGRRELIAKALDRSGGKVGALRDLFLACAASPHHRGENEREWAASLDWLLNPRIRDEKAEAWGVDWSQGAEDSQPEAPAPMFNGFGGMH